MTCPVTVRLGVVALGAADEAERILIESHLTTCPVCRAELAGLEPLPGLLAQVPVSLLRVDAPPMKARAQGQRALAARRRGVTGVAAAAALAAAAGVWLTQPGTSRPRASSPPAAMTLSGANPATHVRVAVRLTGTSWGTSIQLRARGLPINQTCELIVRSRTGGSEITGTWQAWADGPVIIPASAGWHVADIASIQIATATRTLITVTTGRARGPAQRGGSVGSSG